MLYGLLAPLPLLVPWELPVDITIDRLWDGTPVGADEVVHLRLEGTDDHLLLHVDAPFHGDPPPPGPPGPTWKLWNHEVVELFILGPGHPRPYLEVEVGPHGHHIVLELLGARNVVASGHPLDVTTTREGERWRATARIPRGWIPIGADRLNATAIHGVRPDRRFLSWQVLPGDGPDFHRIDHFAPVDLP
jgi:hypothetical protein